MSQNLTVGVIFSRQGRLYALVNDLTVILISDEIPAAIYHCDRILIMRQRRIRHAPSPLTRTILSASRHGARRKRRSPAQPEAGLSSSK